MFILFLIFFYTFPASLIFLHGIGLERLSMNAHSKRVILPFTLKISVLIFSAAAISWVFGSYILSPIGLTALIPIFTLITIYLCETALHLIYFDNGERRNIRERIFAGGTVIFALYHAFNYLELIGIIFSALLSMIMWSYILYAVKQRIDESKMSSQWKNAPLLLIGMGIIALALYAWDRAWVTSFLL